MPDLFDLIVFGTVGLVGFGCYVGYNQTQKNIR